MTDNNAVFVDSNYFIALFNISDTLHAEALALAESMVNKNIVLYVSNYIMLEVLTVLSQRVGREAARVASDNLVDSEQIRAVHITEELHSRSLEIFRTTDSKNVSLVDCSILAVLNYVGIKQLLTFDTTDFKPLKGRFNFDFYK
jgi:predicted nucleic acid-binding protein